MTARSSPISRPSAITTTSAGACPARCPAPAATVFEEGLAVPPIKLYSAGVRNEAVFTIIKRNTRVPEMLAADLDSEVQACVMGARRMAELFERFGRETVEACFQAILDKCRDIFRTRTAAEDRRRRIRWEDYVEHDGLTDPQAAQACDHDDQDRRTASRSISPAPIRNRVGPINWPADYAGGAFLIKWIAPILRNLADTPERAAEIHVNEGVCEVFDVIFPPKGTLITPEWPAATNARSFVLLRCLGLLAGVVAQAVDGRMPADQETIRYTGFYRHRPQRQVVPVARSARRRLRRALLRRRQRRHSHRAGFAQPAGRIHRDALSAAGRETRRSRTDSGGAGKRRGGLGYEKHYRALVDCRTIVTADRVRLGCYGVNGGKAGTAVLRHDRSSRATRATSAVWSTARRCWPARSCACAPPAAAAGATRSSASRTGAARRDRRQSVGGSAARRLRCRAHHGRDADEWKSTSRRPRRCARRCARPRGKATRHHRPR